MNKREENIDSLRVIAAILVIITHVSAVYILQNMNTFNLTFATSSTISIFTRCAVPIFLMISGRYLLSNWDGNDVKGFYKKKLPRVIIPCIAWNIIYTVLILLTDPKTSIYKIGSNIINEGASIHLWFFYLIIELYILTPVFYKIKNGVSRKAFRNISCLILFIGFVAEISRCMIGFKNIPLYYPVEFMGYFLIGYVLKDYKPKLNFRFFLIFYILLCSLGASSAMFVQYKGSMAWQYFHTSLNPLTLLEGISLYIFFSNLNFKKYKLASLAKYSLGIYGVHIAFLTGIIGATKSVLTGFVFFDIIIYVVIIFILSLLTSILLYKFKFTRKIVN
ncbi:Surface polysaccharide O-acyltransferase, integral membrane enzyme [Clostridium cavendishii DSM 21758]|uniref:Surface polysaccharide O-acyltransferase, integral membrane enzyme n=1 Tax=Clostridium cavendishii DSM 21758 TaxID=1121302 RepID=A0A1M6J2U5_9CLOT|nr:acyltransferase [Clostridium cavendishii]SHJ41040.1 Surface polysaccharide O-acyltransferase, integral membrane enzyme [Clostridium cavendishii DSM 21758]